MTNHKLTLPHFWKGRAADDIQYWYQNVRCVENLEHISSTKNKNVALLGYAVDEGVYRNQGRIGAKIAPDSIKNVLGSMSYHLPESLEILDFGTIWSDNSELEIVQKQTKDVIFKLLQTKHFPVVLGGGHDLALPHGSAIIDFAADKGESVGILNLDAHFDLREKVNGLGHSGSPFLELINYAKLRNVSLQYCCLGIQKAANPAYLFETAKRTGTWWLENEACTLYNWEIVQDLLSAFADKVNKIYLTIDMDGFSSAYAPGVSAPSPMGYSPNFAFKVIEYLAKSKKLISIDVVELNPSYDQDLCTARLAARCIEFTLRKIWE